MRILLPVVVALVPFLIAPHLLFYFDVTPKVLVIVFGAAAALIISVRETKMLAALLASRIGRWFCILLAAWVVSLAVSTLASTNPWLSLNGGNWRRFGLLTQTAALILILLAAAYTAFSKRRLRILLRAMVATGGLVAVYGICQYFGWDPFQRSETYHVGEGIWTIVRPPATLGHADYFGVYLLFVAFISAAVLMTEVYSLWKVTAAVSAGLAVFAIVLSGTRAAVIGLLLGGAVLLVWLQPRMRIVYIVLAGCLLAALIAFYYSSPGEQLRARMRWSREDVRGGARLLLWRDSLRMAKERPLLGYGPETFPAEFPRFQSVELARDFPDFYHESPHNIFLDTLTSQGLPGLLILAGIACLGLYAAVLARFAEPILARALGSCLIAVLAAQQFTAFVATNALYFGLMVGILVSLAPRGQIHSQAGDLRYAWPVSVGIVAVMMVYGVRLLVADYYLQRVNNDLDHVGVAAAAGDYAVVTRWHPAGSSADLFYSRRMAALSARGRAGASQEALKAGIRATQTSEDRQNAWYNVAGLYATQNNVSAVEESLRASIDWAPNWFKPHWILAQVLSASGRLEEAEKQAVIAADLDAGKNPEVNRTLDQIRGERKMKGR